MDDVAVGVDDGVLWVDDALKSGGTNVPFL